MSSRTFHTQYSTSVVEGNLGKHWRKRKQLHGKPKKRHDEHRIKFMGSFYHYDRSVAKEYAVKHNSKRAALTWHDFDDTAESSTKAEYAIVLADDENEQILLENGFDYEALEADLYRIWDDLDDEYFYFDSIVTR